jgi:hypothetical protein
LRIRFDKYFSLNLSAPDLFFFGSGDTIRDENIRLISKMSNIDEIDLKVFEFKYYPHGLFGTAYKVFYPLPTSILFEELDEFLNKKE